MARQDLGTEGEASSAVRPKHGKAASNPQRVPSGDLQHNTIVIPSTGGRQSRSCARRSQPNSHRVCAEEEERISEQVIGSSLVPNDDGNNMNIDNERIPEQGAVADTPTQSTRKPPRSSRRANLPFPSQSEGSQVPSASVNHTRRSNVAKPSNESVPSRSTTLPSTRARTALKPPRPPVSPKEFLLLQFPGLQILILMTPIHEPKFLVIIQMRWWLHLQNRFLMRILLL